MIRNIFQHGSCPITFVKTGIYPTSRYNTVQDQNQWFVESILPWQQKAGYAQPVQKEDRLSLQIWANGSSYGTSTLTLTLYSCSGSAPVRTDAFTRIVTPNNIELNGYFYDAFFFEDNQYWSDIPEGTYFAFLTVTNVDGILDPEDDTFISNPINLKTKHENTRLIRYTSFSNRYGLIVEGRNQVFERRFFCALIDKQFGLNATGFIDSKQNTTELSCFTFFTWRLAVGGAGNLLPEFELDALNEIVALDSKLIDKQPFVRFTGAQIEKVTPDVNFPKYAGSIQVTVASLDASRTWISGDLQLMVFTLNPIVILWSRVGVNGIYDFYYGTATFIADLTALEAYATLLNTLTTAAGLEGTFYANANGLFYTLGLGEFYTEAESNQLTQFMTITHTIASSGDLNFDTMLQGTISGSDYAIVAPDFSIEASGVAYNSPVVSNTSHYFAAVAGTYLSYIFHDNTMYGMSLSGDYLTATGGKSPFQLNNFTLTASPLLTTYNIYTSLKNSILNLQVLFINYNISLSSLTGYWSAVVGTLSGASFYSLIGMGFQGNNMNASQLSVLYNNIAGVTNSAAANGLLPNSRLISTTGQLTGQTPSNSPTAGNSTFARTQLVSTYFWFVNI